MDKQITEILAIAFADLNDIKMLLQGTLEQNVYALKAQGKLKDAAHLAQDIENLALWLKNELSE